MLPAIEPLTPPPRTSRQHLRSLGNTNNPNSKPSRKKPGSNRHWSRKKKIIIAIVIILVIIIGAIVAYAYTANYPLVFQPKQDKLSKFHFYWQGNAVTVFPI